MSRTAVVVFFTVLLCSLPAHAADVELHPQPLSGPEAILQFADFNGDGLDDILGYREIQLNLGGRFGAPISLRNLPMSSQSSHDEVSLRAVQSINGDAYADLLLTRTLNKDIVLLGKGSGTFTAVPVEHEFGWIGDVFDFSGDGKADLLWWKPGEITLQRGLGDGKFVNHQTFPWTGSYYYGRPPAAADLNGDGRRDFVVPTGTGIGFYIARPDGLFTAEERFTRFGPNQMEAGDFDGDGNADIVFVSDSFQDLSLSILYGDGTGRFPGYANKRITETPWGEGGDARHFTVGDFVAGGAQEIAYGTHTGAVIVISGMNGQVREIARNRVDGLAIEVHAIRIRSTTPEMFVFGHRRSNPNHVAWAVETEGTVEAPQALGGVRTTRRLLPVLNQNGGTYRLDVESSCPVAGLTEFTFEREGLFTKWTTSPLIVAAKAAALPEELYIVMQVQDGSVIRTLAGSLVPAADGTLRGKLLENQKTPCGRLWASHTITAVAMQ